MNWLKFFLLLLISLVLTGCTTIQLEQENVNVTSHIAVNDLRPAGAKVRENEMGSAVVFLEEERFKPPVIDLYVSALEKAMGPTRAVRLDVETFRMVDFMGRRAASSGMGLGLVGEIWLKSMKERYTDWALVDNLKLSRDQDAIICLLSVRLDGRKIDVAVSETYRISAMAPLVFNDPDFRRALNVVIRRAAAETLKKAEIAP